MNREICKNCKWFESENDDSYGYCLRYPKTIPKDDRDRCGEFKELAELGDVK